MSKGASGKRGLSGGDVAIVALVALLLYGTSVFSGRPLSVHEARLPQLAREMVWGHGDWLLPTSGGRPWLERPPLPHWITALSMMWLGRVGSLWSPRVPAALSGLGIGLMAAWMSARWFGRRFGLLAGVVTLSSFEIYQYATLAEDDIYLGLLAVSCVALAVRQLWRSGPPARRRPLLVDAVGPRPWHTVLFFVVLGLTNLVKGPLVGAVPVIATLGIYLLLTRDRVNLRHYAWLWGWLIFVALTLAWPWWAWRHYPDVVDNWRFDYLGKNGVIDDPAAHAWDHPWWYYLSMLPLALAPWTWATLVGLFAAWPRCRRLRASPTLFIVCWAITGVLVLSVPLRKHHQYLVPVTVPWAILGAMGVVRVGGWLRTWQPRLTVARFAGGVIVGTVIASAVVQLAVAGRDARSIAELKLVQQAKLVVPPGETLLVNADLGSLVFFRVQYMLRHDNRLIQNLSYLRDPALARPDLYVLTRAADANYLGRLGTVLRLAQADVTGRDLTPGHRLAIFRLTPFRDLQHVTPPPVSVMQAMGRRPGPWLDDAIAGDSRVPGEAAPDQTLASPPE